MKEDSYCSHAKSACHKDFDTTVGFARSFRADATTHKTEEGLRKVSELLSPVDSMIWREKTSTWLELIANVNQRFPQGSILSRNIT